MKQTITVVIVIILASVARANTSIDPKELGTYTTRAGANISLTILCSDMFDADVLTIEILDAPEGSTLSEAIVCDCPFDPDCLGVCYSSEFYWTPVEAGDYWLMIVVTDLAGMTDYGIFVLTVEPDPDINRDGIVNLQDFGLFAQEPEAFVDIGRFARYWLTERIVP